MEKIENEDVWEESGKIDIIKFAKLISSINKTTEKEEMINLLKWLGYKVKDNET